MAPGTTDWRPRPPGPGSKWVWSEGGMCRDNTMPPEPSGPACYARRGVAWSIVGVAKIRTTYQKGLDRFGLPDVFQPFSLLVFPGSAQTWDLSASATWEQMLRRAGRLRLDRACHQIAETGLSRDHRSLRFVGPHRLRL